MSNEQGMAVRQGRTMQPALEQAMHLDRAVGEQADVISELIERLAPLLNDNRSEKATSAPADPAPPESEHTRHLRDVRERVENQTHRLRRALSELEV